MEKLLPCVEFQDWVNENIGEWMKQPLESHLFIRKAFIAGFNHCHCYFKNEGSNEVVLCEECSKLPMHNPPNKPLPALPEGSKIVAGEG